MENNMVKVTKNYRNGDVITIEVDEKDSTAFINQMFIQARKDQEEKYAIHTPFCSMSSIMDAFDEYSSEKANWN